MRTSLGPRGPRSQPPWGVEIHTRGVVIGQYASPPAGPSPLQAHSASPAELRERIEAERGGRPFLVLRDGDGAQRILHLEDGATRISVGRAPGNELSLHWDTEVSRLHAELEQIAGEWTVSDDGLSRNGTFVNSARISGRTRLRDGDVLRVGQTVIAYRRPEAEDSMPTQVAGNRAGAGRPAADPAPGARRARAPLQARRVRHAGHQPGDRRRSCSFSVDAVKSHLRTLFARFGIEHLPQNQKRSRLVAEALQSGVIATRDL